jgi:hypothetical protein
MQSISTYWGPEGVISSEVTSALRTLSGAFGGEGAGQPPGPGDPGQVTGAATAALAGRTGQPGGRLRAGRHRGSGRGPGPRRGSGRGRVADPADVWAVRSLAAAVDPSRMRSESRRRPSPPTGVARRLVAGEDHFEPRSGKSGKSRWAARGHYTLPLASS